MNLVARFAIFCGLMLLPVFCLSIPSEGQSPEKKAPAPKLITLDLAANDYARILGGPPETVTMRSGLVVLDPDKSVGTHNTKNYEEVLVVLGGAGKMTITGGPTLELKPGSVAYCPPMTEHNVTCTGPAQLRYVYIVANAK